jgi:two-component system, NtrC family, nitrogen regulation sensor histidine kinase NtrY
LVLWILSGSIPSICICVLLMIDGAVSRGVVVEFALATIVWLATVALSVRAKVLRHIRTLSNLVEAAREHEYNVKATHARDSGELAALYRQINHLIGDMEGGRHAEQELLGMLRKVVSQIGVAIVVCDAHDRIRLVNPPAAKLLLSTETDLLGVDFSDTALVDVPLAVGPQVLDFRFPGAESRWQVSQQWYRHQGKPSRILFIVDLRQVLAEEEILVWQRLIRVISHEVNNSLTPISSLCQTLETIIARGDGVEYSDALRDGLGVIGQRAKGLKEFISVYSRIARLPEAQKVVFPAARLVDRVQGMFAQSGIGRAVDVPDVSLYGDPVHLEQALINLIKNALEANEGNPEPVTFGCSVRDGFCEFEIVDNGKGIANTGNLFVPFYTTKVDGAGIGLVLCRKVAAMHFGRVTLENRSDGRGAVARLVLPLPPIQSPA